MVIITIDGPAGSGKSTIAKRLAKELNFNHIDSGAIYRTLTLMGLEEFQNKLLGNEEKVATYFSDASDIIRISWNAGVQSILLKGIDVSKKIRDPEITRQVYLIANHPKCREVVNQILRPLAKQFSFVIEGRDTGTIIFPNATYKFYLDANIEVRTMRRAKEMGIEKDPKELSKLTEEIKQRDQKDISRRIAPLKKTIDSIYMDTSNLEIHEIIKFMKSKISTKSHTTDT